MRKYFQLLHYAFQQRSLIALGLALTACSSTLIALQPWPLKLLVDYALGDKQPPPEAANLLEALSLGLTPAALIIIAAAGGLVLFVMSALLDVGLIPTAGKGIHWKSFR